MDQAADEQEGPHNVRGALHAPAALPEQREGACYSAHGEHFSN